MTKTEFIDVRGDGRIVLSLRAGMKNPKYQARIRVPGATGYRRVSTKCSDLREAERFALDLYEELYFHVKSGGNLRTKIYKSVFSKSGRGTSPHWVVRRALWIELKSTAFCSLGSRRSIKLLLKISSNIGSGEKTTLIEPLTNDTLNRERTAILAMFKYCLERGYLTSLPRFPKF